MELIAWESACYRLLTFISLRMDYIGDQTLWERVVETYLIWNSWHGIISHKKIDTTQYLWQNGYKDILEDLTKRSLEQSLFSR